MKPDSHRWFHLRVPASSANLGPGFDALGLALGVYLTCRFRRSELLCIQATGRDAGSIPPTADNLIWQTALSVAQAHHLEMPPIELHIHTMRSCWAKAWVERGGADGGCGDRRRIIEPGWKPLRILDEAARLEGHPDTVAPCTLGSIVASAIDSGGVTRAVRMPLPQGFDLAIVVPDFDLPTSKARAVLPSGYSREDAVFNVQRAALLIAALATGTTSVFPACIEDRFHQPYREALVPGLHEILRLRAPGLLGCALSGAGPSILVFFERGHENVCDLVIQIFRLHGHDAEILHCGIPERGFELT